MCHGLLMGVIKVNSALNTAIIYEHKRWNVVIGVNIGS